MSGQTFGEGAPRTDRTDARLSSVHAPNARTRARYVRYGMTRSIRPARDARARPEQPWQGDCPPGPVSIPARTRARTGRIRFPANDAIPANLANLPKWCRAQHLGGWAGQFFTAIADLQPPGWSVRNDLAKRRPLFAAPKRPFSREQGCARACRSRWAGRGGSNPPQSPGKITVQGSGEAKIFAGALTPNSRFVNV